MDTLNDPRVSSAVEAYFEAITAGDEQGWIGLFAADCVVHDPVGAIPAEGRESLPGVWLILRVPFESVAMEAVDVFHGGNGAAVKWDARGKAESGREARFHGISVFEVAEDGKIQTLMSYWDPAEMMIAIAG